MSLDSGSHVLVVDDCEPLRYLKALYLQEASFHVSQAGTGQAALESVEGERPDLILLDVNLPDMHGSEVCRAVKARWNLPIIWTSSVDIPAELQSAAEGCLISLDRQDLLTAVRTVLDNGSCLKPQPVGRLVEDDTIRACAAGSSDTEISAQARAFESCSTSQVLDASGAPIVVLNRCEEIIFCNRAALNLAGITILPAALGLRLCEAFHCIHATESLKGCKTAQACQACRSGKWHIVRSGKGADTTSDLIVTVSPIEGRERFVVCTLTDFSPEKQRRLVERQFFHDILNIAGGVKGCAALLRDELMGGSNAELAELMDQCAGELVSEIRGQQQLLHAEAGQLPIERASVRTLELVQTAAADYRNRTDSKGRTILVDPLSQDLRMETDPALLSRVLGDMLKDALAATKAGGTVSIGCKASQVGIEFCVHDERILPQAQLQAALRSSSSKDGGLPPRNYGMKLLTERYLGGTVRLESGPLDGTRLIAAYPAAMASAGAEPERA